MAEGNLNSLEYEPTWIVAAVSLVIVLISLCAERALHFLGKTLKRNKQDALFDSLQKLKSELMLLGFISLLLTVFQGAISQICIPEDLTNTMLPCGKPSERGSERVWNTRQLLSETEHHCDKGKAPLLSLEALHQLHIFIFVLAVVYVIFCATTMVLGRMKLRRWRNWEQSIKREVSQSMGQRGEAPRITQMQAQSELIFEQRAFRDCTWHRSLNNFMTPSPSQTTLPYVLVLYIEAHCPSNRTFDFYKYMMRTLENDFKNVISIRWYLWAFAIIFLSVNIKGWHSYFWLSFLPLILLLLLGAKLEHIITCMAKGIAMKQVQAVKPSDDLFWFGRPRIVLYLLQFILFQNSFEIAFLFWVWCTYGIHSCILDKLAFVIPRLIIGIIVQVICSYSTLPLYTIVTQMVSTIKQSIFDEHIGAMMNSWAADHPRGHSTHSLQACATSTELIELHPCPETGIVIQTPPPLNYKN